MKFTGLLLTAGVMLLTCGGSSASEDPTALQERMNPDEFERAGLDKLSARELEFLNAWLGGERAAETAEAVEQATAQAVAEVKAKSAEQQAGLRPKSSDRRLVESNIVGKFTGWHGRTLFKLANGQLWRQIDSSTHRVRSSVDPKVRIEPKLMGSWKLYVEGTKRGVKVTRIQ